MPLETKTETGVAGATAVAPSAGAMVNSTGGGRTEERPGSPYWPPRPRPGQVQRSRPVAGRRKAHPSSQRPQQPLPASPARRACARRTSRSRVCRYAVRRHAGRPTQVPADCQSAVRAGAAGRYGVIGPKCRSFIRRSLLVAACARQLRCAQGLPFQTRQAPFSFARHADTFRPGVAGRGSPASGPGFGRSAAVGSGHVLAGRSVRQQPPIRR